MLLILCGIVLLLLPESGKRIFTVNDYHGPSAADAAGLLCIIASWASMLLTTIMQYRIIRSVISMPLRAASILTIIAGTLWIIAMLANNSDSGWIPGAIAAAAGYGVLFYAAFKK